MIKIIRGSEQDMYVDKKYNFAEWFNRENGAYIRSGVIEGTVDTGVDPFMRSMPSLIDIGIMGHCVHGKSGLCLASGVQCYQSGLTRNEPNMSVEDYESIMHQSQGVVMQCLHEDEIVLSGDRGVIRIADVKIGEKIHDGFAGYIPVVAKSESVKDIFEIAIDGGRKIKATADHTFPVLTEDGRRVEKQVCEIVGGDRMVMATPTAFNGITELNIARMIIDAGLGYKFNVRIDGKRSVKLSMYDGNLDSVVVALGVERSQYTVPSIIPVSAELMRMIGYYVGDGSRRSYVMGLAKEAMFLDLIHCVDSVFPNLGYHITKKSNKYVFEFGSNILHKIIFDIAFGCRGKDKKKQLPNFIFDLSQDMVTEFLAGYFCDGDLKYDSVNGASVVFNTSSKYLASGLSMLFSVKFGIIPSVSSESGGVSFDKSFGRSINRSTRYRVRIYNNHDINIIKSATRFHWNSSGFLDCVANNINSKNSRLYKDNVVVSVTPAGMSRVVDIEVKSDAHLFVTSNGILSHNCALGGRGDPNKHEQFGDILRMTREYGIIPNYTTSGLGLTDKEVALTKDMCGAAAVSWYRSPYTLSAIGRLVDAGVTTNIHYVLGNNSIDEANCRLLNNNFPDGISAVVFLLHKPVGLGQQANVLQPGDPKLDKFFQIIDNWNGDFKIGFDSCSIPGIINYTSDINMDSIDTCEGARFSMYITPDMIATPCSFDQELKYGVSLRDHTIEEAWSSPQFEAFRDQLRNRCPGCAVRQNCMGGCPLKPEVVLCNRREKTR